ncbi:primosomal protein N' [Marinobacterium sp. LSUCC0821]|uniref:primosomal protein N' n=1 Tax=Marinobacterium sp. LSUCC0821 TaxID=2668067 RepID=UPI001451C7B3|nr:primosomal protein N' [Marinobacterium sp. LSUCC0821]QJD71978.1 primosomal protein N' [Marinobacterium sp. LSUCC0821]
MFVRVALSVPLNRLFDYSVPTDMRVPEIGVRVLVPFGPRSVIALVIETDSQTDLDASKVKPIKEILDPEPIVNSEQLKLGRWAASYYKYPIGDALMHLLPTLARKEPAPYPKAINYWQAASDAEVEMIKKGAVKQRALLHYIKTLGLVSEQQLRAEGFSSTVQNALVEAGLIKAGEPPSDKSDTTKSVTLGSQPLQLNSEQADVLDAINNQSGFNSFLIAGVTGSGKTEVYLQAIEQVLQRGQQVLMLVPEIGLTPQLVERFKARFNTPIVAIHSGLTDRQRFDAWQNVARGEARILIGTRSTIFVPFKALGMILIDEEHDTSFKQQEGFRYHARDLALVRARNLNIPVVMGSATPSLESLQNATEGRNQQFRLTQRAGSATEPSFELLDIRGMELDAGLAPEVLQRIDDHLTLGNQALVFINRRGFAPTLVCQECGTIVDCTRCDAHMTLHRSPPKLHCHHCDRQTSIPRCCNQCGSDQLRPAGSGTERIEDRLNELFPSRKILRVDRDSTQSRTAFEKLMHEVNTGEPCILVGTQMLAKGHHFPGVTLVVIINADAGLFSADTRGMERMSQLILQVAGRAGRAERPGEVILQTLHAEHPLLNTLVEAGYMTFASQELANRQIHSLPPFTHQAIIRAEANKQGWAEALLRRLRQHIEETLDPSQCPTLSGPFPSIMEKRAGMYRAQLLFTAPQRSQIQATLHYAQSLLEQDKAAARVRWNIDIDPVESL